MPDPRWRVLANKLPQGVREPARTALHKVRNSAPDAVVSPRITKLGLGRFSELGAWLADGCLVPTPDVRKRQVLHEQLVTNPIDVAIETGTLMGDTTEFLARHCRRVVTIELSPELAARARARFAGTPAIEVVEGDSGTELAKVLATVDEPALLWLDGHYSGEGTAQGESDCPLLAELEVIEAWPHARRSVVAIDDAIRFGEDPSYPTLAQAREYAMRVGWDCFTMQNDIILLHPFPQPTRV